MITSEDLKKTGYYARRGDVLAVNALLNMMQSGNGDGAAALLIEGRSGVGKTALGEAVAQVLDAESEFVYELMHSWTDENQLFFGVDAAAAVAGDAENVRQEGVLARAARLSQEGLVVLVVDEIDKAPERAEALLLDCFQSGRVPVKPGVQIQADLSNLLVFVTSNGVRPLSDPLMRRVRRYWMPPLPAATVRRIALEVTDAPKGVVTSAHKAATVVADADGALITPQEIIHLVDELQLARSVQDVRLSLAAWAARGGAGREAAERVESANALWGNVKAEGWGRGS
jgi:MoxR-like ATPase